MTQKSANATPAGAAPGSAPPQPTAADVRALAICAAHGNQASELLEILHDLQHDVGFVPEATIPVIARAVNLSRAEVHGVVTFYHDFRREPAGRHVVKVCRAEACQSMGADHLCAHAQDKLKTGIGATSDDGAYTLEQVFCLGNCALSPAVMVDDKLYGKVDTKRFDQIIDTVSKERG